MCLWPTYIRTCSICHLHITSACLSSHPCSSFTPPTHPSHPLPTSPFMPPSHLTLHTPSPPHPSHPLLTSPLPLHPPHLTLPITPCPQNEDQEQAEVVRAFLQKEHEKASGVYSHTCVGCHLHPRPAPAHPLLQSVLLCTLYLPLVLTSPVWYNRVLDKVFTVS